MLTVTIILTLKEVWVQENKAVSSPSQLTESNHYCLEDLKTLG